MTHEELLARRWGALFPAQAQTIEAAVTRLGAVQAQDFNMALLAIAQRSTGTTTADVETALDGPLTRLHVMRPTWHIVAASDVRWLVQLTADRVAGVAGSGYRTTGLTSEIRAQARRLIEKALQTGPRTREELMAAVAEGGLETDGLRSVHYMMDAELSLVACNGPRRGKTHTYDLVDRRVPVAPPLKRDEALAKLALRFIAGHGPATDRDFAWWSGLSLTDARRGLQANNPTLQTAAYGENEVWYEPAGETTNVKGFSWLPAFDEYIIAFTDRSPVIDPQYFNNAFTKNGIFRPIVLFDGLAVGTWTRGTTVTVDWFDKAPKGAETAIHEWETELKRFSE